MLVDLQIADNGLPILFFDRWVIDQVKPSVEFKVSLEPFTVKWIAVVDDYRVVISEEIGQDVQHGISEPDIQADGWFVCFNEETVNASYFRIIRKPSSVQRSMHGNGDILRRGEFV
jgi:hypothetical protein